VNPPEPEQLTDTPFKVHIPDIDRSGLTVPCMVNVSVPPPEDNPLTVNDIAVVPPPV
jgi:hypothetical protein